MPEQGERCQLCGSLVEVVSSDEGTSYYRPAEQGDAICIHCGAEVFWGLPLPEDPCFECGKPVAEQGDVNRNNSGNIPELNSTRTPQEATGVEQGDVETIRGALAAKSQSVLAREEQFAALDRLVAALASAERRLAQLGIVIDWKARAEKAERALAEITKERFGVMPDGNTPCAFAAAALRPSEEASDES